MGAYAEDGLCHNSEPGTYNHECGKPATWIGTHKNGWRSGYCDKCKAHGHEGRKCVSWEPVQHKSAIVTSYDWPILPTFFPQRLTEERIERLVEAFFDAADRKLMAGHVSQADYDVRAKQIAQWADDILAAQLR